MTHDPVIWWRPAPPFAFTAVAWACADLCGGSLSLGPRPVAVGLGGAWAERFAR